MSRTLVTCFAFTILAEGGFFIAGEVWGGHGKAPKANVEVMTIALEMPRVEPDDPETETIVENQEPKASQSDLAPPMQEDVPQILTPLSFVQCIEPPLPKGARVIDSTVIFHGGFGHGLGDGLGIFDPKFRD